MKVATGSQAGQLLVGELLEGSLLVEVWHQLPRREGSGLDKVANSSSSSTSVVMGRRLAPSFQDVLLGVASVPLQGLLRQTGVRGWYPLLPPAMAHTPALSGPPQHPQQSQAPPVVRCNYVGGVEVCGGLCSQRDEQLVSCLAAKSGWQARKLSDRATPAHWQLHLHLSSLWTDTKTVLGPHSPSNTAAASYCFVRYRFFDAGKSVSLYVPCHSVTVHRCSHFYASTLFIGTGGGRHEALPSPTQGPFHPATLPPAGMVGTHTHSSPCVSAHVVCCPTGI